MSQLRLHHETNRAVTLFVDDRVLLRYVYVPEVPANESPRPYIHPLNSYAGDTLSAFRPNDHPWHHGLSLTVTNLSGMNFWGGPTCRREDGYKWRDDHGRQQHLAWQKLECDGVSATLAHTLEWRYRDEVIFREERTLHVGLEAAKNAWSLRWRSRLVNSAKRPLALGNPHSTGGLAGSHYTGLQFRAVRALLDDHGDATIRLLADGGHEGEKAVHGSKGRWMEWHGQRDETLRRVVLRFENNNGPISWFVRRNYPLAAYPFQCDTDLALGAGEVLELDHSLTVTSL